MTTRQSPRNLLTLSRIELYDLVCSQPLAELAREFGLSDAELCARCVNVHVPLSHDADAERIARGDSPERTPHSTARTPHI